MVRITGIIALIACIQTIVFAVQASRLKETIEKMDEIARGQTEDMKAYIEQAVRSANAMEAVAEDMAISARAATDSVAALKERTAQQMRAYITVVIGTGVFQEREKGIKFEGKPSMVNSGHTPAYKVSYVIRAAILPISLPENFDFPPLPRTKMGGSFVGQQQTAYMSGVVDDFIPNEDVEGVKNMSAGRMLYVWGTVTYEDIFGQEHKTEFCQSLFWTPDNQVFGYYTPGRNNAD